MRDQFADAWVDTRANDSGFSYPADKPAKRIDYIWFRRADPVGAKRIWIRNTLASDHVPVVADLKFGAK
jgi:endonuclease/exonuclease/phosphatase family metal-dependent hydrolase